MIPAHDTQVQAESLALLTEMFKKQPNITGLLASFGPALQRLEDAAQAILTDIVLANHPLPGGPWDILDKLGAIVGQPRNGLSDAAYLPLIKVKIRVNISQGKAEDIIQVVALLVAGALYIEQDEASFIVQALNASDSVIAALKQFLPHTRSSGVNGQLSYTDFPNALIFNVTPMGDAVSGQFPNAMGSVEQV